MNLLSILLAVLTSKAALGQVSGKTGLSQKQIKKLMMIAIPILLKYMEGYSEKETAAALEITVPTLKARLFKARRQLERELKEEVELG